MEYLELKKYIDFFIKEDDFFTETDYVNAINLSLKNVFNIIINKSSDFYNKNAEYTITIQNSQFINLPSNLYSILDIEYELDNLLYEIQKGSRSNRFNNSDLMYILEYPKIKIFNNSKNQNITLNYIYIPTNADIINLNTFIIDIPNFAENYFIFMVFRFLKIKDTEIEQITGIDFNEARDMLYKNIELLRPKYQKNYKNFTSY
jgi:hypothetical protein